MSVQHPSRDPYIQSVETIGHNTVPWLPVPARLQALSAHGISVLESPRKTQRGQALAGATPSSRRVDRARPAPAVGARPPGRVGLSQQQLHRAAHLRAVEGPSSPPLHFPKEAETLELRACLRTIHIQPQQNTRALVEQEAGKDVATRGGKPSTGRGDALSHVEGVCQAQCGAKDVLSQ